MKNILPGIIALFIITVGHAQVITQRGKMTIDSTKQAETTEDPDNVGKNRTNGAIDISPRLRDNRGASVFGGKFKYTTVAILRAPGSHTLYAAGMNGNLKYLFAIDTKGNKIPATYLTKKNSCIACIGMENGRKPCYIIDCNDVPVAKNQK